MSKQLRPLIGSASEKAGQTFRLLADSSGSCDFHPATTTTTGTGQSKQQIGSADWARLWRPARAQTSELSEDTSGGLVGARNGRPKMLHNSPVESINLIEVVPGPDGSGVRAPRETRAGSRGATNCFRPQRDDLEA